MRKADFLRSIGTVVLTILGGVICLTLFVGFSGCLRYRGEPVGVALIKHLRESKDAARVVTTPVSPKPTPYVTYRNARYGFSLTYDSTRYFLTADSSVRVRGADFTVAVFQKDAASTSDPANLAGLTVSVVEQKRPKFLNDPQFAVEALYTLGIGKAQEFAAAVGGDKDTLPEVVKVGGQLGFRFDMSGTVSGSKRRWRYYQVYAPHASYVFSLGAPRADWAVRGPVLDEVVHSFKITD